MKKLFYTLFALAALAMTNTSCSDELENGTSTNSNEVAVSFKVELENAVGSRALIGDGTKAKNLFFAVFKAKDANALGEEIEALAQKAVPVKDDLTATINTRLVKGQSYNFVFWAQTENQADGTYYNVTNMGNIMVKYNANNRKANNEDRDAFYAVRKNLKVTGPINETITLKRPFAQVNVGTKLGSLAEAAKAEVNITKSQITIKQVATELDPYSGQVKSPTDVTYLIADIPTQKLKDVTINGVTSDYEYLSMNYILVNDDNTVNGIKDGSHKSTVNAELSIYDNADLSTPINTFAIPNVPVQRNWRTNIIGDILSETVTFNIVIDPKFDTDENGEDHNYELAKELAYAFANGGEVTLENKEYELGQAMTLTGGKNVVLNLNGASIKTKNGADAFVVNDGTLTIKGEGSITTEDKTAGYAVFVDGANAVVNIYGGTYTIGLDDVTAHGIYACNSAVYTKNGGVANIYGGTYKVSTTQTTDPVSKTRFLLNRNGTAATAGGPITVYGGKFEEFNPADNYAEGPGTNYVATGYKSEKASTGDVYYVIKGTATVAATAADLTGLATANAEVTMVENLTATAVVEMAQGATLEGNGNVLTLASDDNGTYAKGISTAGGTIKNLVIDGQNKKSATNQKGYRAIFIENPTEDVIIDNVSISGVAYTMNTVGVDAAKNLKLVVSNSTLVGWTSYVNFASAMFNNCHFGVGSYYDAVTIAANPGWNGCIRPYDTTTLSNCTFDSGFQLMLDKLPAGKTITLKNCMVGNEVVTATNIEGLLNVTYDANKIKF